MEFIANMGLTLNSGMLWNGTTTDHVDILPSMAHLLNALTLDYTAI